MTRLSYACAAALLLMFGGSAVAASGNDAPKSSAGKSVTGAGTQSQANEPASQSGTTIIGEDESPVGLYITPWKNDYAERGLARPQHELEEFPAPIDPDTFDRQNEYYDTITAYRNAELAKSAPPSAAPNPQNP